MHLAASRLGIAKRDWPEQQLDFTLGESPRFELWVYVTYVDATIAELAAPVMKPAEDMPWGERVAYLADPDGNPVAIAHRP